MIRVSNGIILHDYHGESIVRGPGREKQAGSSGHAKRQFSRVIAAFNTKIGDLCMFHHLLNGVTTGLYMGASKEEDDDHLFLVDGQLSPFNGRYCTFTKVIQRGADALG